MPLKGFVDEARKTNKLMEMHKEERKQMQNNFAGIIDVSDGQSIPKEKLEEIRSTNVSKTSENGFNYIKKNTNIETDINSTGDFEIARPRNNFNAKTDFEKEYLNRQKQSQSFKREIQVGSGTGLGTQNNNNFKQKVESKHGNIIANVIRESSNRSGQKVPWQDCKHLKRDGESLYCREFHCFCKKDACPFSCK